jgi:hypothetical protein
MGDKMKQLLSDIFAWLSVIMLAAVSIYLIMEGV